MDNFRSDSSRGSRGKRSGGRSRGFDDRREGFRDRDSRSFERRIPEMHEVTCDKCKKQCEVPFKPTKGKPVFCSDCFRKDGDSSPRNRFEPENRDTASQPETSPEQLNEINAKLDKILEILKNVKN